jgi:glycosyltransferase involved in cell wall biosynthesis
MAMKRPVIATDVPGCRELVIPRENGWRIQARSSAQLAEALLMSYRTRITEREQYGEKGRRMIKDGYSNKIVADHYLQIIRKLILEKKE